MYRPRIKERHLPVRLGDDLVSIGGKVPGIEARSKDPDGWVWALMDTLDGTRTVDQVITELIHRFPKRSEEAVAEEVVRDLGVLMHAGYLEDAAEGPPLALSTREVERYSRARMLWEWMTRVPRRSSWDTQLLLRQARVVVIGVGGTGSTAAQSLVLTGVGQVHCVEPDVVELSNLARQVLFTEPDVGQPKVDVAVTRLRAHNSDVHVTGEALTITGPATLMSLAARFDVVVLAADQPSEIRWWANRACHATGTAWVHSGYHGPQVNYGFYRPGTGPCFDCLYTADQRRRADLPPRTRLSGPREKGIQAGNSVSAGLSGQLAANAAMSLITGVPMLPANCEYAFNLLTSMGGLVASLEGPLHDCPTCGQRLGG